MATTPSITDRVARAQLVSAEACADLSRLPKAGAVPSDAQTLSITARVNAASRLLVTQPLLPAQTSDASSIVSSVGSLKDRQDLARLVSLLPLSSHRPVPSSQAQSYRSKTSRKLRPYLGTQPAKHGKLLAENRLAQDMKFQCSCNRDCMQFISRFQLQRMRSQYLNLGGEHRQLEWLITMVAIVGEGGKTFRLSSDPPVDVCRVTFLHVMGISDKKLSHAVQEQSAGELFVTQPQENRLCPKATHASAWLQTFIERECDRLPTGECHTPAYISLKELHSVYLADFVGFEQECASGPYFEEIRRNTFPHLHAPKQGEWNRCELCMDFRFGRRSAAMQPRSAASQQALCDVLARQTEHVRMIQLLRRTLAAHLMRARLYPGELSFLIADQSAFPRIPRLAAIKRARRLKFMEGGTLSGSTDTAAVFYSLFHDKGPNLVCTQLYLQYREVVTSHASASLARELYVQTDRASGENHNKWTLGLLGLFVHWGWCLEATFGMLLSRHAHQLIDATLFRPVNQRMKAHTLRTPADVFKEAGEAFVATCASLDGSGLGRKSVAIVLLLQQLDFKALLERLIMRLRGISKATEFLVKKNHAGKIRLWWKAFACDSDWLGEGGVAGADGVQLFLDDEVPDVEQLRPSSQSKEVSTEAQRKDMRSQLFPHLEQEEVKTYEHIFENGAIPNVEVVEAIADDGGWQDGQVAQNGRITQPHDQGIATTSVNLRVFTGIHVPPGGWAALPQHVQHARAQRAQMIQAAKAKAEHLHEPASNPVIVSRPPQQPQAQPRAGQQDVDQKMADEQSSEVGPVLDEQGCVALVPGEMVAVWTGVQGKTLFQYTVASFRGVVGEDEDVFEDDDLAEIAASDDEAEGPHVYVQWYGNSRAQSSGKYTQTSSWIPGWRDTGDSDKPLVFSPIQPAAGSSMGGARVVGATKPWIGKVHADSIADHGFELTFAGRLPRDTVRYLLSSDKQREESGAESPTQ